jgi:hypothetical protein
MNFRETEHLRVLIANERTDRLALVTGHDLPTREVRGGRGQIRPRRRERDVSAAWVGRAER